LITGFSARGLATLIVWLSGVIAVLVLPLVTFRKALAQRAASSPSIPPLR
jgi:hypothetical protein